MKQNRNEGGRTRVYKVVSQLWREMWVPLLIAAGWTVYNLWSTPEKRTAVDGVTVFGGSFFLICWAFAQWFRVKKQQAVESGLQDIVTRLDQSITNFDTRAGQILDNLTGGDSFCYLLLVEPTRTAPQGQTVLLAEGSVPLAQVSATVIDWDLSRRREPMDRQGFELGNLIPTIGYSGKIKIPWKDGQPRSLKIDFFARNGRWRQHIIVKLVDGVPIYATKVERGRDTLYEWVQHGFPRDDLGNVDWQQELLTDSRIDFSKSEATAATTKDS